MPVRVRVPPDALERPGARLEQRAPRARAARTARVEIALRLAPQLAGSRTAESEREQQPRVARMRHEPPLALLDARQVVAAAALAVERDELARPLLLERVANDRVRALARTEIDEETRRRGCDARPGAVGRGRACEIRREPVGVDSLVQVLDGRRHPQLRRELRRNRVALLQNAQQAQHLVPVLQPLFGAQQQAQGRRVPRAVGVELAQDLSRLLEPSLVDGRLGFGREARIAARAGRVDRAREPAAAPDRVAHRVRRARGEQGRHAGCLVESVSASGQLLRPPVAALHERLPGLPYCLVRAVRPGAAPECGDLLRQPGGVRREPQQPVEDRKKRERGEQEERQGDLDPPGRVHEQRIPLAVPRRERERDGKRGDDDEGDQPAHRRPI